jgi:hypothetical protein
MELLYKLTFMEYLHGINSCNLIHGIEPHWVTRNEELRYSCCSEIREASSWWLANESIHLSTLVGQISLQNDYFADPAEGLWIVLRWILGRWNELAPSSSQWLALLLVTLGLGVLLQSGWNRRYCTCAWRICKSGFTRSDVCVVFGWHSMDFIDMDCWVTGCPGALQSCRAISCFHVYCDWFATHAWVYPNFMSWDSHL